MTEPRGQYLRSSDTIHAFLTRVAVLFAGLIVACCSQAPAELVEDRAEVYPKHRWMTPAMNARHTEQHVIYSSIARENVSYRIFVPPKYREDTDRRFPVVYWLHGSKGGVGGIRPLVRYFGRAIRERRIPPLLVVFPNGMAKSLWVDSKDRRTPVESVFINEILPDVDTKFRTIPSRKGRLIEGFSMGGYGAARIGLKHNQLFSAISMLGAGPLQPSLSVAEGPKITQEDRAKALRDVFGNDQEYFRALSPWVLAKSYAREPGAQLVIRQVIGGLDRTLPANKAFSAHLTRLGIAHDFYVVPGIGHRALKLFKSLGNRNWQFYRRVFSTRKLTHSGQ